MLKKIISKIEDVDEKLRDLYEEKADGKFHLKVEADDSAALMRAKEHEKEKRKEAETKAKDLEARLKELENKSSADADAASRKAGDVAALEESWQKKMDAAVAEKQTQLDALNGVIKTQLVDNVAATMAGELSATPKLLIPFIKERLQVEINDGAPITRVLDTDKKPSALSLNDLKKEFFASEDYAAIITGSQATGGGAAGGDKGGASKKVKWADYSTAELVTLKREKPAEYDKLKATRETANA